MKYVLFLIFAISSYYSSSAQQTTIQFFPENPTEADSIMVVMDFSFSSVNCDWGIVTNLYFISENTINFHPDFCPNWQDSTFCETSDTVFLSPISSGVYDITVYVGMTGQCPVGNAYYSLDTISSTLMVDLIDAVKQTEEFDKLIQLFPNPTKNEVVIELATNQSFLLSVFNEIGQVVLSKKIENTKTTIPLDPFPNGIYFFTLQDIETGKTVTEKLLINK